MATISRLLLPFALFVMLAQHASAQASSAQPESPSAAQLGNEVHTFVEVPAVSGYEQQLVENIAQRIKSPKHIDEMGNITVTLGTGSPHRLIATPIDEPGFVVGGITPQGYLTLQRLPQGGNLPLFNELYSAQPVKVGAGKNNWIWGSVAGPSIHLQPQRQHPPSTADLDNMYVDLGADSPQEVRSSGADVLSPVAIDRTFFKMGFGKWTAPAIGDRFGAAVLLELLSSIDDKTIKGSVTIAFVTQQWSGARGLQRVLYREKPDELIYVGRLIRPPAPISGRAVQSENLSFQEQPGSGVIFAKGAGAEDKLGSSALQTELGQIAQQNKIPTSSDISAPLLPRGGYLPQPKLPERSAHLSVATAWPSTPAEVVDGNDVAALLLLLRKYVGAGDVPKPSPLDSFIGSYMRQVPKKSAAGPTTPEILKYLVESYGVSGGHEAAVRQSVKELLPEWAKPETDDAGNLILHWAGAAGGKSPRIAVVAHMDEIGYEVHAILPDGRLELETKGGGVLAFFLGHAALVHSANGIHPGVLELPEGWEAPDFQWPRSPRMTFRMDVGARSPEQVSQLGIKQGDFVTISKRYRNLLDTRASARAFDDRVGCTALVAATWALGQNLNGRDVTFIWSTSEELGLEGAAAAAKKLDSEGRTPNYVFAIDTFVSSDSPIESPRFADAKVGQGFVVRAVDNSNIVPHSLVEKVLSMAKAEKIPAQYGVTGGGNDGAAFLMYGSTDVALGWPLRYSHSPAEVVDVNDVDALAKIVAAIARSW